MTRQFHSWDAPNRTSYTGLHGGDADSYRNIVLGSERQSGGPSWGADERGGHIPDMENVQWQVVDHTHA